MPHDCGRNSLLFAPDDRAPFLPQSVVWRCIVLNTPAAGWRLPALLACLVVSIWLTAGRSDVGGQSGEKANSPLRTSPLTAGASPLAEPDSPMITPAVAGSAAMTQTLTASTDTNLLPVNASSATLSSALALTETTPSSTPPTPTLVVAQSVSPQATPTATLLASSPTAISATMTATMTILVLPTASSSLMLSETIAVAPVTGSETPLPGASGGAFVTATTAALLALGRKVLSTATLTQTTGVALLLLFAFSIVKVFRRVRL